jgi:exopolysaccharide biosynthesis protein
MKIKKLILYILLIMCLYNIILKNYNNHFSLKANLVQTKMSIQCSFQIEYDSVPWLTVQIDNGKYQLFYK